jgi:hypothetical protein
MHHLYKILYGVLFMALIVSCHNKITCPAYQSKFILDEDMFKERFSLFNPDSTPKDDLGNVKKSKYGIIVEKPYNKKFNEMKNVPMETIYPQSPDSIMIAWAVPDSITTDSLGGPVYYSPYLTIFNNDQALYDALYGHLLRPPISAQQEIQEDLVVDEPQETTEDEPKKKFRLFKKRKKEKEDEKPAEEESP